MAATDQGQTIAAATMGGKDTSSSSSAMPMLPLPQPQNAAGPSLAQQPPPLAQQPVPPWPQLIVGKYNGPNTDPVKEVVHYNRNGQVHGLDYLPQREVKIMFASVFPVPSMQEGLHNVGRLKEMNLGTLMPT